MVGVVGGDAAVRPAERAFLALYDTSLDDIYSYLFSRLHDRSLAEDLTQDVFLAGARRAAAGQPVELPWLVAVARNKVVDHWRARSRQERRLRALEQESPAATTTPVDDLDEGRAVEVLAGLNPTYRLALVLRHVDGLGVPDVAAHLGRTVAAAEQILSRARASFRRAYEEQP